MRKLAIFDDAVIIVRDGRFAFVGREKDIDGDLRDCIDDDFDACGATAVPGFIDSHTHLPFAGYRETEFNRRLHGETYEQIAASGGGIASSVHATRRASQEELVANSLARARTMSRYGTTTAEAKSGYGLSVEGELKQLRAIRDANERSPVRLIPTCMAAHDFPPESRGSAAARRGRSWPSSATSSSSAASSPTRRATPFFAPAPRSASSRACTPTSSPTPTALRSPHPSAAPPPIT
jgi:imidazolonepropionase